MRRTSSRAWVNNGLDEGVQLVKRRVQGQIDGECAFVGASSNGTCNLESGSNIILSAPGGHDGGPSPSYEARSGSYFTVS